MRDLNLIKQLVCAQGPLTKIDISTKSLKNNTVAIIPCAGKGSRMDAQLGPKALRTVNGICSLDSILQSISSFVSDVNIVIDDSEASLKAFNGFIRASNFPTVNVTLIPIAGGKGDGDAIFHGINSIEDKHTANTLIVWGDVFIHTPNFIKKCLDIYSSLRDEIKFFIPTFNAENPYVAFQRDSAGYAKKVFFKRKNEVFDFNEQDLCLFFLDQDFFIKYAEFFRNEYFNESGEYTTYNNEFNLLEFINYLHKRKQKVLVANIGKRDFVSSFNSEAELEAIALESSKK
ncbi:NTP transferase domain-containing protein [bacterium]|nr:NTP transferase domain-containing protein [bacterium]